MKKTKEDIVLGTIKYICIAALLIVVLFPIIWLVAGSFKLEKEILSFPPTVFGEHFSMKSFQRIFDAIPFLQYGDFCLGRDRSGSGVRLCGGIRLRPAGL